MALAGMWLSPGAAWFVFFNVVVGAIAVMSWMGQAGHAPSSRRRLARTASIVVMERLRSFSMFPFHYSSADYSLTSNDYCSHEVAEDPMPPLLRRVEPEPFRGPEPSASLRVTESTATPATMAPPSTPLADAAASESEEEEYEDEEEPLISLDEAYALARQGHAPPAAAPAADPKVAEAEHVKRRRRANAAFPCGRVAAEEVEGKAELNARADSFIRRFREDLKLERINSIINYTNALRRRGAVDAPAPAR